MSKVRSKNTSPELAVRKLIYSLGYRYRLHGKKLPGKPDLVFPGRKKVIFVHGCFWHYHDCKKGKPPKSRLGYWLPKLLANRERDKANISALHNLGWETLIVWQCEVKDFEKLKETVTVFLNKNEGN